MTIQEALQIVIDLARQNVIDEREMPDENARQLEAISVVEDMTAKQMRYIIVNDAGDYWSNELGWTEFRELSDKFPNQEFNLPIGGIWQITLGVE